MVPDEIQQKINTFSKDGKSYSHNDMIDAAEYGYLLAIKERAIQYSAPSEYPSEEVKKYCGEIGIENSMSLRRLVCTGYLLAIESMKDKWASDSDITAAINHGIEMGRDKLTVIPDRKWINEYKQSNNIK